MMATPFPIHRVELVILFPFLLFPLYFLHCGFYVSLLTNVSNIMMILFCFYMSIWATCHWWLQIILLLQSLLCSWCKDNSGTFLLKSCFLCFHRGLHSNWSIGCFILPCISNLYNMVSGQSLIHWRYIFHHHLRCIVSLLDVSIYYIILFMLLYVLFPRLICVMTLFVPFWITLITEILSMVDLTVAVILYLVHYQW